MINYLRYVVIVFTTFLSLAASAQCHLHASVNSSSPMLCPGGKDTLSTQFYDTYQWYRNNKVIPGADKHFLVILQAQDEGASFTVRVTKNSCADTSDAVVLHSYVFSNPRILLSGDVGVYNPNQDALVECPDDTLRLTLDTPYTSKIQWYNSGKKLLGAHEQTYDVTRRGNYAVCAAPNVCPSSIVCDTASSDTSAVKVVYNTPKTPVITERNDTLLSTSAQKYQWYFSTGKIADANKRYYVPQQTGTYKVGTENNYHCKAISDPYRYTKDGLASVMVSPNPVKDVLHIRLNTDNAKQLLVFDLYGNLKLKAAVTSKDQSLSLQNLNAGTYILQVTDTQGQLITSVTIIKQ
jgi:hypothetical protein